MQKYISLILSLIVDLIVIVAAIAIWTFKPMTAFVILFGILWSMGGAWLMYSLTSFAWHKFKVMKKEEEEVKKD